MKRWLIILSVLILFSIENNAQLTIDGQLSGMASFSPQVEKPFFSATRYIPELNYNLQLDTFTALDFEASVNLSAAWNQDAIDSNVSPYRLWARYTGKNYEVRAGLQKIEFGSATILRPLQWFNQVDPRDPLQLTNGVYGVLGRYVFKNNANIRIWGLYGNSNTRGFEVVETNVGVPEFGGRLQLPVRRGELGITYHHRTADTREQIFLPRHEMISENRVGLDAKWDVGVGIWVETSHQWKDENVLLFTNQTAATIGLDYTFAVGNGLTTIVEHMILSYDEKAFEFLSPFNFTAATFAYPIGFFDNVSSVLYYNWEGGNVTVLINYEHQFSKWSLYVMGYYTPENTQGIQQNDLVYSFAGPGIRLMAVYSH